ncbi:MAG TPA: hypothetical protein VGA03_03465 [Anaerolineales bacterium]
MGFQPVCLDQSSAASIPDEIVDRVFDVVIGVHILGVAFGQFALDHLDTFRRVRVSLQIVPEQQSEPLVWAVLYPDMDIGSAPSLWLDEQQLRP